MTPAPPLEHPAAGPIACFLAADHRRLEAGRAYPTVRVAPHHDSALVGRHIEEALAAAGAIRSHFHRSANPETP